MTWKNQSTAPATSTSSGGFLRAGVTTAILCTGLWTTATQASVERSFHTYHDQTRAGLISEIRPREERRRTSGIASAILEIRRIFGSTWDELGTLFGVNRRSVHNWVEGKQVNTENDRKIWSVLGIARLADRGSVSETRTILMAPDETGKSLFSLMQQDELEQAVAYTQKLPKVEKITRRPLSPMAQNDRPFYSVSSLIAADQTPVESKRKGTAYRFDPIKPKQK